MKPELTVFKPGKKSSFNVEVKRDSHKEKREAQWERAAQNRLKRGKKKL